MALRATETHENAVGLFQCRRALGQKNLKPVRRLRARFCTKLHDGTSFRVARSTAPCLTRARFVVDRRESGECYETTDGLSFPSYRSRGCAGPEVRCCIDQAGKYQRRALWLVLEGTTIYGKGDLREIPHRMGLRCEGIFRSTAGPKWLANDKLDISAVAEGEKEPFNAEFRQTVRIMLADRFQLKTHVETREMLSYVIRESPGGVKLKTSEQLNSGKSSMGKGHLDFSGVALGSLAQMLAGQLDRPVVDGTGLTSRFDGILDWSPEGDDGPSILTAPKTCRVIFGRAHIEG